MRKLVVVVALLGVLAHAAALARHNGRMLGLWLEHQDLVAALLVICHGGGGSTTADLAKLDLPAAPSDHASDCPLCMGLAVAAILPAPFAIPTPRVVHSERIAHVAEFITPRLRAAWPPTRGPPVRA